VAVGADRARIRNFLSRLGTAFHAEGRIYLTGDTALVYGGLRPAVEEIALAYMVAPVRRGPFLREVQRLAEQLQVNVREDSPAEEVPLPAGAAARARPAGRFGQLELFLFDPYSVALAKLAAASDDGVADVRAMRDAGWLDAAMLGELVEESLRRYQPTDRQVAPDELRQRAASLAGPGEHGAGD
jgi:hypothetical protein